MNHKSSDGRMPKWKRAAVLTLAILIMSMCLVPLTSGEQADAVEPTDYKVSTPGYIPDGDVIEHQVGNGHSWTIIIYIQNFSDHIFDVTFYSLNGSSDVYADKVSNLTLKPAGDSNGEDLLKQPYTIHVKEITPSHNDAHVGLNIMVTDLSDDSYDIHTIKFHIDVVSAFDTSGNYNKILGLIDNTLPEPFDTPIYAFLITLIIFVVLAAFVIKLLVPAMSGLLNEATSGRDKKRFKVLLSLAVILVTLALFVDPGLKILGADVTWIYILNKVSMTILVVVLAIAIWKVYLIVLESLLTKLGKLEDSKIDLTLMPLFSMFGKLFLWVGGSASILHIYGMDLSGILLSAGIVTLGITLGAQSVLSQFFSGILLLLTRPFAKGDYVVIDDVTHIVKDVKLMYTEFYGEEFDRIITMPNNVVSSATLINMSKYNRAYRLYIFFEIPYDIEVQKAEEIMLQLAEESDYVLHDYTKYKKPAVKLIEFGDAGIQLRLDVTIKDFASKPTIQSNLKKQLYVKLAENGIEAPYSRIDVKILDNVEDVTPA